MSQEHISNFLVSFKVLEEKVKCNLCDENGRISLASEELQKLTRFVSEHASRLPSYELRKAQATIADFQSKIISSEAASQPKSKFKFNRKPKSSQQSEIISMKTASDQIDSRSEVLGNSLTPTHTGLSDETFTLNCSESALRDIWLDNLKNCCVTIKGIPSTLHMTNLINCKIIGGPILTSIFMENCQHSVFTLGCQQLRIHKSSTCDFYLHVRSRAIIEDCTLCRFAPYTREYKEKQQEFHDSQLDVESNNWNQVDDFNWLSVDTPSPNWTVLPEEERILDW